MRTLLLCTLAALIGGPALAQTSDEPDFNRKCYGSAIPDQTIEACTAIIAGGLVNAMDLGAAFKYRGTAYDDLGQYDKAIADYGHAIAINPGDADVLNDRGTSYSALGNYEHAIRDFDRALSLNRTNAMVLSNRCFAEAVVNRLEEALADCNESLRLRPANANTFASRGFANLKLGRWAAAIADYDEEIRIYPGNPYSLFGRSIAKRRSGDVLQGKADMAAARAIAPDIAETMAKLGVHL
jgi:tetratricopeptide (TPR) repeat protein